jgi:hypothetical protein
LPAKRAEIAALEEQSGAAGFWDDPRAAQPVMRRLSLLNGQVGHWQTLADEVATLQELYDLARGEGDAATLDEVEREAARVDRDLATTEFELMMSGPYDANDALVTISAGAGGQHVNKTSSAVRITHLPTGIVVTCQNERSQIQNRETAMTILRARLLERQLKQREEEEARLRGEYRAAEFGNQIRSYVLHPYTMVKDHRSEYQTSNVEGVLNGDLDPLVESTLQWQVDQNGR